LDAADGTIDLAACFYGGPPVCVGRRLLQTISVFPTSAAAARSLTGGSPHLFELCLQAGFDTIRRC